MRRSILTLMEKRRCIEFVENLVMRANGSDTIELPYKDLNSLVKVLLGGEGDERRFQAIKDCLVTSLSAYGFKVVSSMRGIMLVKANNERLNYVKLIPALRKYLLDEVLSNYEKYIVRREEKEVVLRLTRRDIERLRRELGVTSLQLLVYALTTTAELMGLRVLSVKRGKFKLSVPLDLLSEVSTTKRF